MSDIESLEQKYGKAPVAWAIVDVLEDYIEGMKGALVTLDEIKREIVNCEFEPGLPELHRILAEDSDFLRYVFGLAQANLQGRGYVFAQVDSCTWDVSRPAHRKQK